MKTLIILISFLLILTFQVSAQTYSYWIDDGFYMTVNLEDGKIDIYSIYTEEQFLLSRCPWEEKAAKPSVDYGILRWGSINKPLSQRQGK